MLDSSTSFNLQYRAILSASLQSWLKNCVRWISQTDNYFRTKRQSGEQQLRQRFFPGVAEKVADVLLIGGKWETIFDRDATNDEP
jgi:hypothetical protein